MAPLPPSFDWRNCSGVSHVTAITIGPVCAGVVRKVRAPPAIAQEVRLLAAPLQTSW